PSILTREPDSGPGSRDYQVVGGTRNHRRTGGACALMFVMVGRVITTSPRVVMPNSSWVAGWPATLSLATRSGPMIGSRVLMRFCRLKKYVSNASTLVSGDAANTMRSALLPEPPPQINVTGSHGAPGWNAWLKFMSIPGVADPTVDVPHSRNPSSR